MEPLVWTEVFGCGPIAGPVVRSYLAHHSSPLTVYGMLEDLECVPDHPLVRRVVPTKNQEGSDAKSIAARYGRGGHAGTARLWAGLIVSNPGRLLVHIDSDQVFVGNAVDDVLQALREGASIAGPRRPYLWNECNRKDLSSLPDTLSTFCFGFITNAVPRWPRPVLDRAIRGGRVSLHPALDFFDPVTLRVLRNKQPIAYLDSPEGGTSSVTNWRSPFLNKIIPMPSGAATGCALTRRGIVVGRTPYERHALKSWALFEGALLNDELSTDESLPQSESVLRLKHLDKQSWTLH
jgi:hypothetical protein